MSRLRYADRGPQWSYKPVDVAPSIYGEHQTGIDTRQLPRAEVVAFDLVIASAPAAEAAERAARGATEERAPSADAAPGADDVRALLDAWSRIAEEAMRAGAGDLTVTFGLGPSLFERDRLGLAGQRPLALRPLPEFAGDELDPARCGGDLLAFVAGEDAAAVADVVASLTDAAAGAAVRRWSRSGFRRPDRRDPLGFKDGTDNIRRGLQRDRHVWVTERERTWMLGGTFLVVRQIDIDLPAWNRLDAAAQEQVIGRHKESGAPFGRRREFDAPILEAMPPTAHARVAAPKSNHGALMLRRSYNYDTGLLFLAFVSDPRRQFVPVQQRLAQSDDLSRFTTPVGSAVFAIPPGARPGGFIGDGLFQARH